MKDLEALEEDDAENIEIKPLEISQPQRNYQLKERQPLTETQQN
jgi:hypothetical protein